MATMIPSSIQTLPYSTAGERKIFDLLRKALPDHVVVRFEMLLGIRERKPDYTVIDPERGILVLEVKDWGIGSITEATQEWFYVRGYHGSSLAKPQWNPEMKCQVYQKEAKEQLVAMPELRDERGSIIIPIDYFIAFPNITKTEFYDKGLNKVLTPDHILLKEDFSESTAGFLKRYEKLLPKLDMPIPTRQLQNIDKGLLPDITIPRVSEGGFIPTDLGIVRNEHKTLELYQLSHEQEIIAKSLGEGPRLLRGIAGTGKTLIMLYRAKLIAANDESARILILCWNTALSNYMQQAYDSFQFDAKGQVKIKHFTAFARDLLGLRSDPDYGWDNPQLMQKFNSKIIVEKDKFNAIFIDEAQDFRKEWIEYIFNNLIIGEPKERNLIIAADDAQRIYRQRDFSWSKLGFPMAGRSKILKTIFRNSARVWVFSAFLLEEKASYVRETESTDKLKFSEKGGYDPQLIECKDFGTQIEKTIEIIKALIHKGYAARNVLILYREKYVRNTKYPLVDNLIKRLNQEKINYDWIAEDPQAKRTFQWEADTVKISTVHSAKGMDSPVVIILGVEAFQPETPEEDYDELKLMYVAMTRAREFLVLLHTGDAGLVPELKKCRDEYMKIRDKVIDFEKA